MVTIICVGLDKLRLFRKGTHGYGNVEAVSVGLYLYADANAARLSVGRMS